MAANWKKNNKACSGSTELSPNETKHLFRLLLYSADDALVVLTHCCKPAGTFTYRGTAPNQTDDEEKRPDSYDNDGGDQSVHVFKEVVVVVVGDEHIGSDIA